VLVAFLVQSSGALAEAVHHTAGMGMKRDKHGEPTLERLARLANLVIIRTLVIADHYQLRDALRESIQTYYLLLVRHAEAHCNTTGVIAADTCHGLTSTGTHQAEQLAHRLKAEHTAGRPVVQLYSSPVRRARDTARAVATVIGAQPVICPDLRVPDPGPADGQPWAAARHQWPPDPDRPSRPLVDGGEPWRDYLARAHACLAGILTDRPGGRIVVIGHSETVTAMLTLLLGVSAIGALKVDQHPTGITGLTATRERPNVPIITRRWTLTTHNDTTHLSPTTAH
jgi:probable phosphoglycerate mutase